MYNRQTILTDDELEQILEKENPTMLELEPHHPGINDTVYYKRREELFHLAREYRIPKKGFPYVSYTHEENTLWSNILDKLNPLHEEKASKIYLHGKKQLAINKNQIPQFADINETLKHTYNISLIPAEGLLASRSFHYYLSKRYMPCGLFLRHPHSEDYTPEPDTIHDLIGHIPPLTNNIYNDLLELIGRGVKQANDEQLTAWDRIYWYALEVGLIEEKDEIKVLGAGLLSSYKEMEHAFSDKVVWKPFDIEEVMATEFELNQMQNTLFISPSLKFLKKQFEKLLQKFTDCHH